MNLKRNYTYPINIFISLTAMFIIGNYLPTAITWQSFTLKFVIVSIFLVPLSIMICLSRSTKQNMYNYLVNSKKVEYKIYNKYYVHTMFNKFLIFVSIFTPLTNLYLLATISSVSFRTITFVFCIINFTILVINHNDLINLSEKLFYNFTFFLLIAPLIVPLLYI